MKVVLVGPELEENLSVRYLAAALIRGGHSCEIVAFNHAKDARRVARAVMRRRPDLVGLSLVAQRRYSDYRGLAQILRQKGFRGHLTAGGHFASLRAAEILRDTPALDSIVHHDGEGRIVALANALEAGRAHAKGTINGAARKAAKAGIMQRSAAADRAIPVATPIDRARSLEGISWRDVGGCILHRPPVRVANVDTLVPPLRKRPDRLLGFAKAPIVSSRGCAGSCSFCSIRAWHRQVPGKPLRFRSPGLVADEMAALARGGGVRIFSFHDDDFIHPDSRAARVRCREIIEEAQRRIGAPFAFIIKCRPDNVDEELFAYLKAEGLVRAYVGIETHSRLGIDTLGRRTAPRINERALEILGALDVYSCFNLLIFHPETTREEIDENLAFLSRHLDHPFDLARTELYARAALEERMLREGRAIGDYTGYDYRIADPVAETAFDLFADILRERHYGEHSIVKRAQDLGIRLRILERFRPEMTSSDLRERVTALIRDVNADSVDFVRSLVAEARRATDGPLPELRTGFVNELKREVEIRTKRHTIRWAQLALELEGRALAGRLRLTASHPLAGLPRPLSRLAMTVPYLGLALCSISCDDSGRICDPPPPPPVHFSTDIKPRLNASCTAAECHAAQNPAAGLTLTEDESYTNLVGVPSTQLPAMDRVKPDRIDSSYLFHKLNGSQLTVGGQGEQMPKDGPKDHNLIQKIVGWIEGGAKND